MAMLKRFFCCCNIRNGAVFAGFYSLVASLLYTGLLFGRYVGYRYVHNSSTFAIIVYTSFFLFGLYSIAALTLVIGVCKDVVFMLFPWIVIGILCMCHATIVMCLIVIKEVQQHGELEPWEGGIAMFHIINLIMTAYCLLCVFSQAQDLMRGKGTARYYRRRRSRRQRRAAIMHQSAYGAHAPHADESDDVEHYVSTPLPGPCIEPPRYVEKPPPYSTLPRSDAPCTSADALYTRPAPQRTALPMMQRAENDDASATSQVPCRHVSAQAQINGADQTGELGTGDNGQPEQSIYCISPGEMSQATECRQSGSTMENAQERTTTYL